MGYFIDRKFNKPEVLAELEKYGFAGRNYTKVIVTWGWRDEAKQRADVEGMLLWDFRDLLQEIATASRGRRTYFTDDTARTIQLFAKSLISRVPKGA
jgi:hypothetical protein